jgi:tetratricopeptide (TPR) repeat protein
VRLTAFNRSAICRSVVALLACAAVSEALAGEPSGVVVRDPHYGEVLFHFYQDDHFTALSHLITARAQDRVPEHDLEAELLQGGLLLSWGQHVEAGKIFDRVLETAEDPSVRDRAWFYLGKVRYQRGYLVEAQQALENIAGELPDDLEAERYDLLARVYMDQGRFAAAVELLEGQRSPREWRGFARFNTGVALVRMGELQLGARLLEKVGTMRAPTEEQRALRDRANVALGFAYLQADLQGDARTVLQRVRLNGPFSNKALLGAGWADSAASDYTAALASWLELSRRDVLDSAVQESLLAVPYAFAQLGAEPQAADYYARALDVYGTEIGRLDAVIAEADSGQLLTTLLAADESAADGWAWELERLPEGERSRYLYFAVADHRFHEALKSYRELIALDTYLSNWRDKLSAYRDMVATREIAYAQRLPVLQDRVAEFDLPAMQAELTAIEAATAAARASRDVVAVAPAAEQKVWARLTALEKNPAFATPAAAEQRERQRILKGLAQWNMDKEFRLRVWQQERRNAELREVMKQAAARYAGVEAATASLDGTVAGFAARVDRLEREVEYRQQQLATAMRAHREHLNGLALDELNGQKQRLLTYRAQARFALASIYDRLAAQTD